MNACATHGDPDGRHQHQPDREQADGLRVHAEIPERGEERGAVEQHRQHPEEDELRLELELGHPRHEPDREAAEDEQDRVRDAQHRREREQRRDGDEKDERDDADLGVEVHERIVPDRPGRSGR